MAIVNSLEELKSLKKEYEKLIINRVIDTSENKTSSQIDILICGGTGCHASEGIEVVETFEKEIEKEGLKDKVRVISTGCFGFCEKGPIVKIMPDNIFYIEITPDKAKRIVKEHI